MKKIIPLIIIAIFLTACGNEDELNAALEPNECEKTGEISNICNSDLTESVERLCKTIKGIKKYEIKSSEVCANGCNSTTGNCN